MPQEINQLFLVSLSTYPQNRPTGITQHNNFEIKMTAHKSAG